VIGQSVLTHSQYLFTWHTVIGRVPTVFVWHGAIFSLSSHRCHIDCVSRPLELSQWLCVRWIDIDCVSRPLELSQWLCVRWIDIDCVSTVLTHSQYLFTWHTVIGRVPMILTHSQYLFTWHTVIGRVPTVLTHSRNLTLKYDTLGIKFYFSVGVKFGIMNSGRADVLKY
jgi:hypothetical protein